MGKRPIMHQQEWMNATDLFGSSERIDADLPHNHNSTTGEGGGERERDRDRDRDRDRGREFVL